MVKALPTQTPVQPAQKEGSNNRPRCQSAGSLESLETCGQARERQEEKCPRHTSSITILLLTL
jgi:hypothetical protein